MGWIGSLVFGGLAIAGSWTAKPIDAALISAVLCCACLLGEVVHFLRIIALKTMEEK